MSGLRGEGARGLCLASLVCILARQGGTDATDLSQNVVCPADSEGGPMPTADCTCLEGYDGTIAHEPSQTPYYTGYCVAAVCAEFVGDHLSASGGFPAGSSRYADPRVVVSGCSMGGAQTAATCELQCAAGFYQKPCQDYDMVPGTASDPLPFSCSNFTNATNLTAVCDSRPSGLGFAVRDVCPFTCSECLGTCLAEPGAPTATYRGQFVECVPCTPGRFAEAGTVGQCARCPTETYQRLPGQGSCEFCEPTNGDRGCDGCDAGFSPSMADGLECAACPVDQFKSATGPLSCEVCPENSGTGTCTGSTVCQCKPGYSGTIARRTDRCVQEDVDCVGAWSACKQNCRRTYMVTTPVVANGNDCKQQHLDSEACSPDSEDSSNLCVSDGGESSALPLCDPIVVEMEVITYAYKVRVEYVYRNIGCDGVPASGLEVDACGVCGGCATKEMTCR